MLKVENLSTSYKLIDGDVHVLNDLNFEIHDNEIFGIAGESGCGKSMTLKSIAGIVEPDSGSIILDGRELFNSSRKVNLKPQKRRVGYLFQNYALFPNTTVEENILTGLKAGKRYGEAQQKKRVSEMMERFRLSGLEKRYPAQLSGGQQQRVSIARALAKNPKMLLCDEPTGALDYQTGKAILKLLQDMCRQKGMTVVVITHNSALTPMADRVIKIKNGKVAQMTLNAHPTPVEEIEW